MSKQALSAAVKSGAADAASLIRRHLSPAVASNSVCQRTEHMCCAALIFEMYTYPIGGKIGT